MMLLCGTRRVFSLDNRGGSTTRVRQRAPILVRESRKLTRSSCIGLIHYFRVTFDHRVPEDDVNPEVLVINIIEVDDGGGAYADSGIYASEVLLFSINLEEFTGRRVLAVPRCCQKKKGTRDQRLINNQAAERDIETNAINRGSEARDGWL